MALLSGDEQRRRAVIRRHVDIRARLDQRPHHRLVALLNGKVQRRPAVILRLVEVRTRLDQRPHHRLVAHTNGRDQHNLTVLNLFLNQSFCTQPRILDVPLEDHRFQLLQQILSWHRHEQYLVNFPPKYRARLHQRCRDAVEQRAHRHVRPQLPH